VVVSISTDVAHSAAYRAAGPEYRNRPKTSCGTTVAGLFTALWRIR